MVAEREYARLVPDSYHPLELRGTRVWVHPADRTDFPLLPEIQAAFDGVQNLLDFRIRRDVHFVVYGSCEDAARSLGIRVANTFLLAPLHTSNEAFVVMRSPRLHALNAYPDRMLRHLCHELSHVCCAERTGSTKSLGDGNVGMRFPVWVDEGFAECVSARVANRPEIITRALSECPEATVEPRLLRELNVNLAELDSSERERAFSVATAIVWRAVERHGLSRVFNELQSPERWA